VSRALASALAAAAVASLVLAAAAGGGVRASAFGRSPSLAERLRRWASALGRRPRPVARTRLEPLLRRAEVAWTAEQVTGLRRIAVFAAVLSAFSPGIGPLLAAPFVVVAARGPEITLARLARRRARAAARELPLFLDLLSVATSAGLAPQLAVRRAAEPLSGPLAAELGRAIHAADLGRRWRDELEAAAERSGLGDLRRAVNLLVRTERLGSSLADEMQRLAVDVRDAVRARATERARSAPVKMLFPLVFLILPAFLLLTVVPVLLTTVRSIG
jgi:pilus assembly protein TadC